MKDILNKLVYLPLTADGAFEKTLEEKLKERKEQKDYFKDSRVEWQRSEKKITNSNKSNFKRQIVTTYSKSNEKTYYQRPSFNRSADYRLRDENARGATTGSNTMSDRTSSFRIPTKSNKWTGKYEGKQFGNVSRDTGWGSSQILLPRMEIDNSRQLGPDSTQRVAQTRIYLKT